MKSSDTYVVFRSLDARLFSLGLILVSTHVCLVLVLSHDCIFASLSSVIFEY